MDRHSWSILSWPTLLKTYHPCPRLMPRKPQMTQSPKTGNFVHRILLTWHSTWWSKKGGNYQTQSPTLPLLHRITNAVTVVARWAGTAMLSKPRSPRSTSGGPWWCTRNSSALFQTRRKNLTDGYYLPKMKFPEATSCDPVVNLQQRDISPSKL